MGESAQATPPSAFTPPTYPSPQHISPSLTLQPPLSRRGTGPGLILVLDHYAAVGESETGVDPPPLKKWAEEGYAVAQLLVPGKTEDGGEFPLERALEALKGCDGCEFGNGVGLISYLSRLPYYVEQATSQHPEIKAIISYGGKQFTALSTTLPSLPPQLIHIPGPETPRRESISIVPSTDSHAPPPGVIKTYRYLEAQRDSAWVLPADAAYEKRSAGIAHTRSLTFLKPLLGGPYFDLEAVWDEHCRYEFGERDVERTMATMVEQPYVNHIPTLTGGIGQERLTSFYTHHFIFSNPPDTALSLVSRTIGIDRVIDEFVFSLTHTSTVPWLLPGVPPTGKKLEIPFTSVVCLRGDRLCHEHISWDQASALKQAGLLPEWVPFEHEVEGMEKGEGETLEVRLPVAGVEASRKLVDESSEVSNALMEGTCVRVKGA